MDDMTIQLVTDARSWLSRVAEMEGLAVVFAIAVAVVVLAVAYEFRSRLGGESEPADLRWHGLSGRYLWPQRPGGDPRVSGPELLLAALFILALIAILALALRVSPGELIR